MQASARTWRHSSAGSIGLAAALLCATGSWAKSPSVRLSTYTYKTVGDLAVRADVSHYADETVRPAIVWIHGGALIMGGREGVDRRVQQHALDSGCVLVSLDYRLAPETQLPEILLDIEDAFRWIRRDGPRLFHVDPSRLAVVGASAGGYLTLAAGFRVEPPPNVLFSLYGYGDLIGDWYSKPSPHARHHRSHLSRDEAYRQVSGTAISNARDRDGDGGAFYQYCRQTGTWPTAVSGWQPASEAHRFTPYMAVENVTPSYPPTVMIHGTSDTDVPYEQSTLMSAQLQRHNVKHALITLAGAEHGLRGIDVEQVDAAYARAFQFIDRQLTDR